VFREKSYINRKIAESCSMKKHSSFTQNMTLRLLSIRIKSDKLERKLKNILFTYKHFESCLSSSAKITTYTKKAKIQTTLASAQLMRNAYTYKPKHSTQVEYLKNKYKKNQMWQALKETAKKLKPHNLT